MERELKYRGVTDDNELVYPDNRPFRGLRNDDILQRFSIVNQYIGWKDKNNKEIYEDDFVLSDGIKYRVIWFDEGAQFICQVLDGSGEWDIMTCPTCGGDYEIIGNFHENKELLTNN